MNFRCTLASGAMNNINQVGLGFKCRQLFAGVYCACTMSMTLALPVIAHALKLLPWLRKLDGSAILSTMFRSVKISFVQTAALVHAEKHFPLKTSLRWQLIAEFVAKCVPVVSKATAPLLILGIQSSAEPTEFQCTPDMCKNSFALISTNHSELLSYAQYQANVAFSDPSLSAFKPVVLLPHMLTCCGKPVYLK